MHMKAGQTSSRDGIQNILFPVEHMNISQGNHGQYSHQGVNALDLAGFQGGCSPFYGWNCGFCDNYGNTR